MTRCRSLLYVAAAAAALSGCATPIVQAAGGNPAQPTDRDNPATTQMEYPDVLAMQWNQWHGVKLPSVPGEGPNTVRGDEATGYLHNADGAFIAMLQELARLSDSSSRNWPAVASAEAVVAPDEMAPTQHLTTGLQEFKTLPSFIGYRWESATDTRATAEIALQDSRGHLFRTVTTVVWVRNDWRTELPANGVPAAATLTSLDGFDPLFGVPR